MTFRRSESAVVPWRHARAGWGVLVTDRGEVVAEIGPPGHGTAEAESSAVLAWLPDEPTG